MTDNTTKNSVLIVDDEKANIIALTHILSSEYTVFAAKNGSDAIEIAKEHLPDVILLDVLMPEMDGYDVLSCLRSTEITQAIPVIFITGLSNAADEEKGLDLGASDYISKPYSSAIVKLRVRNQIRIVNQIREIDNLSITDQLTGLPNRRCFDNQINKEWARSKREKTPLSLLLLDIDKFKTFNDTYGHQQGDVVLQVFAKTLQASLKRTTDFVARWGGEEFIVLLSNTDPDNAVSIAEKIRSSIEQILIPLANGETTKVTASIGVDSQIVTQDHSLNDLISQADKALYTAKELGRNRVCQYEKTEQEQ